ncbi:MAG: ATP-binding protein [bacterium]|nr:ATP-binding protein [bacterium]
MRIVITGASGTGKTTLLNELFNRGYITVGETARFYLNKEYNGYPFEDDIKNIQFQKNVLSLQLKRECFYENTDEIIFFERCCHDSLIFLELWRQKNKDYLRHILNIDLFLAKDVKFDYVFITDLDYEKEINSDGIRWENKKEQIKIHELCKKTYPEFGYKWDKNLFLIPKADVKSQADFILQTITQK